jgi:hydroxymethylglutaryl-CoA lyase
MAPRSRTVKAVAKLSRRVYTNLMVTIVDVSPRDGLQNEDTLLDTATKLALIERLVAAGVKRIEATSFVHPDRVPQMADAEAVMAGVPRHEGVSYIGLVLNRRGLERALAAEVDEVNAVVVASDTFNRRNQGVSTERSLEDWTAIAADAHAAGIRASVTIAAAFGCPFEGEVPASRVLEIAGAALEAGPDELAVADTIGVGVPRQVHTLAEGLHAHRGEVPLRIHLHNTRNTGYANAVAAVDAGFATLDASVGGIGGCPFAPAATGNIATEDLTYLLDRQGVPTGLDLSRLSAAGTWIAEQLGHDAPALLGRAGPFPPAG